jgi:transcriptional regulator with XRE-family HTH domain
MLNDHFLSGLRFVRERLGVSAHELAKLIGVGVNSYYRFENGTRRIHLDKAWVLADRLGVSLDALRREPTSDQLAAANRALVSIVDPVVAPPPVEPASAALIALGDAWTIDAE